MNALLEAAAEVQGFLQSHRWPFAFIGGLAVLRWGEPRTTQDVDLTLLTGFGGEASFVDPLLARFKARIGDARRFALERRVVLVESGNGTGLDISLAALPFEAGIVARASPFDFAEGCRLTTCSAEDLVVLKAFAARPQDWRDVEGILVRQGPSLAIDRIREELAPLAELKDEAQIMVHLDSLIRSAGSR